MAIVGTDTFLLPRSGRVSVRVPGEVLFKRSSSFGRIYDDVLLLAAGRRNGQHSAPARHAAVRHKAPRRRTRIRRASSGVVPYIPQERLLTLRCLLQKKIISSLASNCPHDGSHP